MFKYYISKLGGGGGSRLALIMLMQGGWVVPKQGKLADVILEHSLTTITSDLYSKVSLHTVPTCEDFVPPDL